MRVGDLVRCLFQPRSSWSGPERKVLNSMDLTLKGELGIIVRTRDEHSSQVMFPQLGGYTHPLAHGVLEIISESR